MNDKIISKNTFWGEIMGHISLQFHSELQISFIKDIIATIRNWTGPIWTSQPCVDAIDVSQFRVRYCY